MKERTILIIMFSILNGWLVAIFPFQYPMLECLTAGAIVGWESDNILDWIKKRINE